jgi:hypothetical protein
VINLRVIRWIEYEACIRRMRNAYSISSGEPEVKRLFERPRRRWENNIRMDLTKIEWEGVDWIHLAQDRGQWRALVNTVMKLRVP